MKTTIATTEITTKKPYNAPQIEEIKPDNEISLILESDPTPLMNLHFPKFGIILRMIRLK
jgi:hypothetical protein